MHPISSKVHLRFYLCWKCDVTVVLILSLQSLSSTHPQSPLDPSRSWRALLDGPKTAFGYVRLYSVQTLNIRLLNIDSTFRLHQIGLMQTLEYLKDRESEVSSKQPSKKLNYQQIDQIGHGCQLSRLAAVFRLNERLSTVAMRSMTSIGFSGLISYI